MKIPPTRFLGGIIQEYYLLQEKPTNYDDFFGRVLA